MSRYLKDNLRLVVVCTLVFSMFLWAFVGLVRYSKIAWAANTTAHPADIAAENGTTAPWDDVAWDAGTLPNALDDNDVTADITSGAFDSGVYTYQIQITDFDFALTSDDTITGIQADVDISGLKATDHLAQLIVGGTPSGDNKAASLALTLTETHVTYGGAGQMWGLSLDYTDVNAIDFGFTLAFLSNGNNGKVYIDYVTITIYYSGGEIISITNSPGGFAFGSLANNDTGSTGLTYFNLTNTGNVDIDVTLAGSNMTGGAVTWVLSDDASNGDQIYGLKAGILAYEFIIKLNSPYNTLVTYLNATLSEEWGIWIWAPNLNVGNQFMTGNITLTATQSS